MVRLLLISFLKLFAAVCFSQTISIHGIITDEKSSQPLAGATINIAGTVINSTSDEFGVFSVTGLQKDSYTLTVSYAGYTTSQLKVDLKQSNAGFLTIQLRKSTLDLSSVVVTAHTSAPVNSFSAIDIHLRPVNTSQDILRMVPGLFIAQHAGGGKAEQIFLRGYDIDHGTDILLSVDGIPVNMVSHAHGQGYADLHFLIPETIDKVNFEKGPYEPSKGNLATAGYVDFSTKDFITENQFKVQAAPFNTQRLSTILKVMNKDKPLHREQFYFAGEYFRSNGYFISPQHFHRINLFTKYNLAIKNNTQFTIIGSLLDSKWDASGQVPERAVESGYIHRFGTIDNSEGGNTRRLNFTAKLLKKYSNGWQQQQQVYFTQNRFNLFSNFTFFLNDPVNGDEIRQYEQRNLYGYNGTVSKSHSLFNRQALLKVGAGVRYDDIQNIGLEHVVRRQFLSTIQKGNVGELNMFGFVDQRIDISRTFSIQAGLRFDAFDFTYRDKVRSQQGLLHQSKNVVSQKINLSYSPGPAINLFFKSGFGFHSNDARVILYKDAADILPRVFGTDLGATIKPSKQIITKATVWQLHSHQEFVYVGDEGIVEAAGKSRRTGIDLSVRYQVLKWLFADVDVNYAKPRLIDAPKGENFVPLAPLFTSIGGLTIKNKNGFSGSCRYRYIGDRPANETNTVVADGYFLIDLAANYTWRRFEISATMENALNVDWKEAQFDTETKLKWENSPVSEIHFTPGTPRFVKFGLAYNF